MAETRNLGLPLLAAGQAQKHVTLNEALTRLDALAQPVAVDCGRTTPPAAPGEGDLHVVGDGAADAWAGWDRRLALFDNGGWVAQAPAAGTRVWVREAGGEVVFDGIDWVDASGTTRHGAATRLAVEVVDHEVSAGPSSVTAAVIPSKAVVIGVTARVLEALEGASGWRLGVPEDAARYGTGYGAAAGAFADGVTAAPLAYYAPTPLLLTAEGGEFARGRVRLAVHFLALTPPRP